MKFIEFNQRKKPPILINIDKVRWVEVSYADTRSTVITFDDDDYLTIEMSYEEVCKRIKDAESNL